MATPEVRRTARNIQCDASLAVAGVVDLRVDEFVSLRSIAAATASSMRRAETMAVAAGAQQSGLRCLYGCIDL